MQTVERIETTLNLPKDLLDLASKMTGEGEISDLVEMALRDYVAKERRSQFLQRDVAIINENAELINEQVEETLEFQAEW